MTDEYKMLKGFNGEHLPEDLQAISDKFRSFAEEMLAKVPHCAERSAGLRKLLEANDCFIRAALELHRK